MKHFNIYMPVLVLSLMLSSCQKYLDIKKTGTQKFIETPEDCRRMLDKYDIINVGYPGDGQASSDDYYLGSNFFPGTLDLEDQDIYTWKSEAIHATADDQWTGPYNKVYFVNLVLEALDGMKDKTDVTTWNNLRGSALFIRSYIFWNIAQQYAKPYGSTATSDPGIPMRITPDLNEKLSRGTVKETYDRITQDLKEAISLLNTTSEKPTRPNKASAYAMLARVYLSMEDYGQALTNANASLLLKPNLIDYNNFDKDSENPFPQFNDEVLFHSTLSSKLLQRGSATGPVGRINEELYSSYATNDLRKVIFFKPNLVIANVTDPTQPSGFTQVPVNDGTYRFTGNYEASDANSLFNGLTVGEVYLTRAECYARTGDFNAAMKDLRTLLVSRFKKNGDQTTYEAPVVTNADQALNIVLAERRKELVMRGQRWTDLRRLNKDPRSKKDLVRQLKSFAGESTGVYPDSYTTSVHVTVDQTWTLPANDLRYTLLIPQQVITNSNFQQNPR